MIVVHCIYRYLNAQFAGLNKTQCRTVALQVGVQNSAMAARIAATGAVNAANPISGTYTRRIHTHMYSWCIVGVQNSAMASRIAATSGANPISGTCIHVI